MRLVRKFEKNRAAKKVGLLLVTATLVLLWGCTSKVVTRLDDRFDADALGGSPSVSPPPNPPADGMSFTSTQGITSTVVADPAGGHWLRMVPTAAFLASPDLRKRAITFSSEPFTTAPAAQIRGHMRVRVDGLGKILVGFCAVQNPDIICAVEVSNFAVPTTPSGEADVLPGFPLARIDDIFALPTSGKMAGYQPGTVITINWSIDQPSRTFSASVVGGDFPASTTFPVKTGGLATTPIQQLQFDVWLQNPSSGTAVFIDDLYAEEYQ